MSSYSTVPGMPWVLPGPPLPIFHHLQCEEPALSEPTAHTVTPPELYFSVRHWALGVLFNAYKDPGTSLVVQTVKNLPAVRET